MLPLENKIITKNYAKIKIANTIENFLFKNIKRNSLAFIHSFIYLLAFNGSYLLKKHFFEILTGSF